MPDEDHERVVEVAGDKLPVEVDVTVKGVRIRVLVPQPAPLNFNNFNNLSTAQAQKIVTTRNTLSGVTFCALARYGAYHLGFSIETVA